MERGRHGIHIRSWARRREGSRTGGGRRRVSMASSAERTAHSWARATLSPNSWSHRCAVRTWRASAACGSREAALPSIFSSRWPRAHAIPGPYKVHEYVSCVKNLMYVRRRSLMSQRSMNHVGLGLTSDFRKPMRSSSKKWLFNRERSGTRTVPWNKLHLKLLRIEIRLLQIDAFKEKCKILN